MGSGRKKTGDADSQKRRRVLNKKISGGTRLTVIGVQLAEMTYSFSIRSRAAIARSAFLMFCTVLTDQIGNHADGLVNLCLFFF